jgi:hypothetical protein
MVCNRCTGRRGQGGAERGSRTLLFDRRPRAVRHQAGSASAPCATALTPPGDALAHTRRVAPRLHAPPTVSAYTICIVQPPGYVHSEAFREVGESLVHGLRRLGHDAMLSNQASHPGRRPIVLGSNLLSTYPMALPHDAILYNLEQIDPASPWLSPQLLDLFRRYELWDYSERNAAQYPSLGLASPRVVPIGYVPELVRIAPATEEDIDVLFYGSMNERRRAAIEALRGRGLCVKTAFGAYGEARDRLIARSKLVLNVHYYEAKVFEIVRISYLLANGRCVVSERGADPAEERDFAEGVAFAEYGDLAETCARLAADPGARSRISAAGRAIMARRDVTDHLRGALGHSGREEPPPAGATRSPLPEEVAWRGSRCVRVLFAPAVQEDADTWKAAYPALARGLGGGREVTLALALPADCIARLPPEIEALPGEVDPDLLLIEAPRTPAGWERVVRGANVLVLTSPRPELARLARRLGVDVHDAADPRKPAVWTENLR